MSTVEEVLTNVNWRDDFRDSLIEMRATARRDRDFLVAVRIGRVLRNRRLFERLYDQTMEHAATEFLNQRDTTVEVADGEFLQWFLEWFADGGWQVIIEFIKALVPLFGGTLPSVVWFAIVSAATGVAASGIASGL